NIEINNDEDKQKLAQLFSDTEFAKGKIIKTKQKKEYASILTEKPIKTALLIYAPKL
ncbi:24235_t:CDS:1, partial [Dentiscutata erythropus]